MPAKSMVLLPMTLSKTFLFLLGFSNAGCCSSALNVFLCMSLMIMLLEFSLGYNQL